jgi:hypothetical protein
MKKDIIYIFWKLKENLTNHLAISDHLVNVFFKFNDLFLLFLLIM